MLKPAWMLLAAAALAAGCGADPVVEPSEQVTPATPVEVSPPPPEPAPSVVEATAPGDAPAPGMTKPEQVDGPGKYRVCAASENTAKETEAWIKRLETAGLRVETETAEVAGKTWQRVVLPGFRNGREARQMVSYLDQVLGIKDAWVVPKSPAAPAAPATPAAPVAPAAPAHAPGAPAAVPKPAPAAPAPGEPESKVPDAEHPQN